MRVISELKGISVVGAGGRVLGDVVDVDVDVATWRVAQVIVRIHSDAVEALGLKKPFWSRAQVALPVSHISGVSDVIVLRSSATELAELMGTAAPE